MNKNILMIVIQIVNHSLYGDSIKSIEQKRNFFRNSINNYILCFSFWKKT